MSSHPLDHPFTAAIAFLNVWAEFRAFLQGIRMINSAMASQATLGICAISRMNRMIN